MVTLFFSHFRDVDKVHDLMDDVAEQQEIANEISDAISNPVGFGQDMDEVNRENYIQPFSMLGKNFSRRHFEGFLLFFLENRL